MEPAESRATLVPEVSRVSNGSSVAPGGELTKHFQDCIPTHCGITHFGDTSSKDNFHTHVPGTGGSRSQAVAEALVETPGGPSSAVDTAIRQARAMDEVMMCAICRELLHDPVTLQPCLHSFCAGCYSVWMVRSPLCPECRQPVERITRHHQVQQVVDAIIKSCPERKRSESALRELDRLNVVTRDMLYPERSVRERMGANMGQGRITYLDALPEGHHHVVHTIECHGTPAGLCKCILCTTGAYYCATAICSVL